MQAECARGEESLAKVIRSEGRSNVEQSLFGERVGPIVGQELELPVLQMKNH